MEKVKKRLNIQTWMAIASFTVGTLIAVICLFAVPPLGEIASSATYIVSEFLILAGALLGVHATFDTKLKTLEAKLSKGGRE